ncbi:disks large homolog 5-like isoform X3 [Peromyscus maniculatus bairdii]
MNDVEKLTFQLQSMTYEQTELYGILDTYTNMDLKNRMDSLDMLKKEHKQVMLDFQKFPVEVIDALNRCKQLVEKNASYSLKLRDLAQLKRNVRELRLENRKLWEEQVALQESCEEVRKLLKEAHEKIRDPCAEQQQGSCEMECRKQPARTRAQSQCQVSGSHCQFLSSTWPAPFSCFLMWSLPFPQPLVPIDRSLSISLSALSSVGGAGQFSHPGASSLELTQ